MDSEIQSVMAELEGVKATTILNAVQEQDNIMRLHYQTPSPNAIPELAESAGNTLLGFSAQELPPESDPPATKSAQPVGPQLTLMEHSTSSLHIFGLDPAKEMVVDVPDGNGVKEVVDKATLQRISTAKIPFGDREFERKVWAMACTAVMGKGKSDPIDPLVQCAKIIFTALFKKEELKDCTLNGKNKTDVLDERRKALTLMAVGWIKKNSMQPYGETAVEENLLTPEEIATITKKVFTEYRSQQSRAAQGKAPNGQAAKRRKLEEADQAEKEASPGTSGSNDSGYSA